MMTIDQNVSAPVENGSIQQNRQIDRAKFRRAKQRVAELRGFYTHFAIFVLVIAGLALLNWATGDDWWVQWVILGWGIGVIAHGLAVFATTPKFVSRWEKRKLRAYLDSD
jgi:hypothetical protein